VKGNSLDVVFVDRVSGDESHDILVVEDRILQRE